MDWPDVPRLLRWRMNRPHANLVTTAMKKVPTLDIRRYDTDRDAFVAEIGAAYREFGFCCISGRARGYTPFKVETAKDSQYADLKEFWHIGREIPRDSKFADVMPPNLWPV